MQLCKASARRTRRALSDITAFRAPLQVEVFPRSRGATKVSVFGLLQFVIYSQGEPTLSLPPPAGTLRNREKNFIHDHDCKALRLPTLDAIKATEQLASRSFVSGNPLLTFYLFILHLMDDVHLSTARHFRYELRLGGKFSAAIWSAGGVPRITNITYILSVWQSTAGIVSAFIWIVPAQIRHHCVLFVPLLVRPSFLHNLSNLSQLDLCGQKLSKIGQAEQKHGFTNTVCKKYKIMVSNVYQLVKTGFSKTMSYKFARMRHHL